MPLESVKEQYSLRSGLSVPSLTQGTGFEAAKDKEEMDDTEAFITHSDHLDKNDKEAQSKPFYLSVA